MLIAIALFLAVVLVGAEAWVARRRELRVHDARTTLSNLGCGVLRLAVTALASGALLGVYHMVVTHLSIWQLRADSVWTFAVAFVLYDLAYYVMHRTSHKVPFLWAVHAVHHESRDFNLTVGARAGLLGPLTAFPFYLSLAFVGVPTSVYLAISAVGHATMFLAHARFIGRFGWLGLVFNSPLHHRLHHSREEEHFDKNFGGVLIVWDRLFGTYADDDATQFGLSTPVTMNPLTANLRPLINWWRSRGRLVRVGE